MTTIAQPRQISVVDGVTGGTTTIPRNAVVWSRRSHLHCPRCEGRLFIGKNLASDGGRWVTNCINCGYERDIP